jgi:hypothetical protein
MGPEEQETVEALEARVSDLCAEIEALQAVIVAQCEAMGEMVPAEDLDPSDEERKQELEDFVVNARDYMDGLMLAMVGERRPARTIEPRELRELYRFIWEGI